MYNTSASDLDRVANDLNSLATTYTSNAQQLDQEVTSVNNAASYLVYGSPDSWAGLSSEAFLGAWGERKARMQQASGLLNESAQYLKQLAQTIDDQLPTIRANQAFMASAGYDNLPDQDQQSVINSESQAQNAIITALGTLNSQLETLAESVKDCPKEKQETNLGGNEPDNTNPSKGGDKGNRKDTANQQEKKDFDYAWDQIQRILGRKLSRADQRRLHDEITKQGFDRQEIIEIGISMFKNSKE